MTFRNLVRSVVLVSAFAVLAGTLGGCHSRAHDAWHRLWHNG